MTHMLENASSGLMLSEVMMSAEQASSDRHLMLFASSHHAKVVLHDLVHLRSLVPFAVPGS